MTGYDEDKERLNTQIRNMMDIVRIHILQQACLDTSLVNNEDRLAKLNRFMNALAPQVVAHSFFITTLATFAKKLLTED